MHTITVARWRGCLVVLAAITLAACGDDENAGAKDAADDREPVYGTDVDCEPDGGPACPDDLECICCPGAGPAYSCVCTEACNSDSDCADDDRPVCDVPSLGGSGLCRSDSLMCCWECQ
jgi:hypothetical protein